jgi:hypothetical protein
MAGIIGRGAAPPCAGHVAGAIVPAMWAALWGFKPRGLWGFLSVPRLASRQPRLDSAPTASPDRGRRGSEAKPYFAPGSPGDARGAGPHLAPRTQRQVGTGADSVGMKHKKRKTPALVSVSSAFGDS